MSRPSNLANPNHPAVRAALNCSCPLRKVQPGERCVVSTDYGNLGNFRIRRSGSPLTGRVVHIARIELKPTP